MKDFEEGGCPAPQLPAPNVPDDVLRAIGILHKRNNAPRCGYMTEEKMEYQRGYIALRAVTTCVSPWVNLATISGFVIRRMNERQAYRSSYRSFCKYA